MSENNVVGQPAVDPVEPAKVESNSVAAPVLPVESPNTVVKPAVPATELFAPDKPVDIKPAANGSLMGTIKKLLVRRSVLIGVGVVVLAAIAVSVVMLAMSHKKASEQATAKKTAQSHVQVIDQASKLDYNSDFKGEAAALQQYLATKPSAADANEASMKLATAYINAGDYENAIVYYKKVQATNDSRYTTAVLNGLAIAYTMKKDNATAIKYYQQAVEVYKSQNNDYDASMYEKIIKSLQSQS